MNPRAMLLGFGLGLLFACGPGEIEPEPIPGEELADEVCSSMCGNMERCGTDPPPDCYEICMSMPDIDDHTDCGAAHREWRGCFGALSCEDLTNSLAGDDSALALCADEGAHYFEELGCSLGEGLP